jgi:tetratricopeptide (TPR) repeat protein
VAGNATTNQIRRLLVEASTAELSASESLYERCIDLDDGADVDVMGDANMPPFRLRPYLLLAGIAMNRGDHERAAAVLQRALLRWPDDAFALGMLGQVYLELARLHDAEIALRRSVDLEPNPATCVFLGVAVDRQGRPDEAVQWLHESLAIDPNYEESHYNLGYIDERNGDIEAAIARYRRALELDPDYAIARARLGALLNAGHR